MMRSIKILLTWIILVWLNTGCASNGADLEALSDVSNNNDVATTNPGPIEAEVTQPDALKPEEEAVADSDGDGYSDEIEVAAGTDPQSAESIIYKGGWPYNPGKDSIADPGWEGECPGGLMCECLGNETCESGNCLDTTQGGFCAPTVGDTIPRFYGYDQYGEMVDLYDFGGQGKIIALEMTTGWCAPCQELARWFLGIDDTVTERVWWKAEYEGVKDIVNSHEVIWVTVVYENHLKGPATKETAQQWAEAFPHEGIPVLVDSTKALHTWIKPSGIPNINLIADDMTLMMYSNRGLADAFDMLLELYGDSE